MSLSQVEADALLAMPKGLREHDFLELSQTAPMDSDWTLLSHDRREEFILTIERGKRKAIRLKYQTRARKVIVLARLDINGRPHRNPEGQSYRPGEWLRENHLHLYREGFEDRVAFRLGEVPGFPFSFATDLDGLVRFLTFCHVQPVPTIQATL